MQIARALVVEQSTLGTDNLHVGNGFFPTEQARSSSVGSTGSLRNDTVPTLRYP
jgi:hypothetical protein